MLEKAHNVIKVICTKSQDESVAKDMEVITLLRELAMVWDKDIDNVYDNRLGNLNKYLLRCFS